MNDNINMLLIGLSHGYQLLGYVKDSLKFKSYLKDLSLKEEPDLIAEELNEDSIKKWKAVGSVARETARHLGIRHLFCDPNLEERKALGIKCFKEIVQELGYGPALTKMQDAEVQRIEKAHWEKRERFWLGRLIKEQFDKCIFLVGADHIDRFNTLLTAHGFRSAIVERDWQP